MGWDEWDGGTNEADESEEYGDHETYLKKYSTEHFKILSYLL